MMRYILAAMLTASVTFQAFHHAGHSADNGAATPHEEKSEVPNFNLPLKTTDLTQIWTDHLWRSGHRVQRNALTGHWRLIDHSNIRRCWGTKEQCVDYLNEHYPASANAAPRHHVIMLHGLMRTCSSMKPLSEELEELGHEDSIRFSYASTRAPIADHAAALRELVEGLPPQDTFSFVGHSMGNIVVRHLIGDLQSAGDPKNILPRCQKMVMLGPPNQGAMIAEKLAPTKVFGWVTGQGGMELGALWEQLEPRLATPPFPFHIIAGDIQTPLSNPLVDGQGDFVVTLEEAKLDGATSFLTVPVLHSFLMDNDEAMAKTVELLDLKTLKTAATK